MDAGSTIDRDRLSSLMKGGWSWSGCNGHDAIELTEEDKEKLAYRVLQGLGAKIVDGVLILGRTEVSK